MALIRLTQVNGRFIRETPSSRHRTQRCPTTPEPPPHVPPTQAKQPSRRALHRISNFTSAPPPFAAIPARPFLAPFAADPPDLRPTTPRSESLARNRATLRYVRELRPARPILSAPETAAPQTASGASCGPTLCLCLSTRQGSELNHSVGRHFNRSAYSSSLSGTYARTIRLIFSAKLPQQI